MGRDIFQVLLIVGFPLLAIYGSMRSSILQKLSPIVLCFAIGIIICNFGVIDVNDEISNMLRDGAILFALPLLLFSSDIKAWIANSRQLLVSFGLCILSGLIATTIAAFLFDSSIAEVWIPSGMMVGIYTGGTPNLFAVGLALGAADEVFTLLNSAEIFWGALYLLFLLSYGEQFYNILLRSTTTDEQVTGDSSYLSYSSMKTRDVLIGLGLSLGVVVVSTAVSWFFSGKIDATIVIVLITSLSILASLQSVVRGLRGTFEVGDYFLLMFGVAAGLLSDFKALVADGSYFILFVFVILLLTLIIHVLLSRIFKHDAHTFIITSTAGFYGPVFIPQVARALKNKSIIVGGISVSLIGLALGNYLGISLGHVLKWLLL